MAILPQELLGVRVAQVVGLGYGLGDQVSIQGGEALRQHRVGRRRPLETLVGYLCQVRERYAGEGERRGPGHRSGDVRHAVVDDVLLDVGWLRVRGWPRGLYAPALVYGDVHDDRSGTHAGYHLARDELGGLRPGDEHGPYDHVGFLDVGRRAGPVGDDEVYPPPEDVGEVGEPLGIHVEDVDHRPHPDGDLGGLRANHAAADDGHLRGGRARHAPEQKPPPPLPALEAVGRGP